MKRKNPENLHVAVPVQYEDAETSILVESWLGGRKKDLPLQIWR